MKSQNILMAILVLITSESFAQFKSKKFFDGLQIRKAFESLDDKKEPAILSLTFPKNGEDTYLINGGISFNFSKKKHGQVNSVRNNIEPFFVYNRNTVIEKEQNNFKSGIAWNYKIGKNISERNSLFLALRTTGEYARNHMDTTHSFFLTSYFSVINSKEKKRSLYINTYKDLENGFQYFVGFSVGPEYQHRFQSTTESETGAILRVYYETEIRISKKVGGGDEPELGDRLIELVINNKGRYALSNSTSIKEGYLPLIKTELVLYPTLSNKFSIGFSYNKGSDPLNGLADQDFYLLALKYKK